MRNTSILIYLIVERYCLPYSQNLASEEKSIDLRPALAGWISLDFDWTGGTFAGSFQRFSVTDERSSGGMKE